MNATTASRVASGASRWGEWPTPGSDEAPARPAHALLDGVELGQAAVLVVGALDQQHRALDRRQPILDVPRRGTPATATRRSSRGTSRSASRWWRAIRVGQIASLDTASRAAAIPAIEQSSTNTCGASRTSPATEPPAPANSRAIEAPSLWPISTGRSIPRRSSSCGQDGVGLVVHVVDRARLVDHGTRPVAVARVDDHRRPTRLASHVVGERAPEVDRAEALVEEHQRRVSLGARPRRLRRGRPARLARRAPARSAVTTTAGGRTAGSCRWPSWAGHRPPGSGAAA